MSERTHLNNGRFLHDLGGWDISGAEYSAGDGDDHYGMAVLSTGGDYIEQSFAVPYLRAYSLHLALKSSVDLAGAEVTARIIDGQGNVVTTQNVTGSASVWTEQTFNVGLAPGTTYHLRIANASAGVDVKIDDVWLWHVPITRASLAAQVHDRLARLATDRSLTTAQSGALTEGSYTYAIDAGLRTVGAIDPETGLPDVRYVEPEAIDTVLQTVEREMLERLYRDYALEVDITVGPRRESLSQISRAIGGLIGKGDSGGGGSSAGRVVIRKLRRETDDFEFNE